MTFEMPNYAKRRSTFDADTQGLIDLITGLYEKDPRNCFGPRGWAYLLEGNRLIKKGDFDAAEAALVKLRKDGRLSLDVIDPDTSRLPSATNEWTPSLETLDEAAESVLASATVMMSYRINEYRTNGFWDGLDHYVEVMVEKKDLLNIWGSVCDYVNVPLFNGKGDTDINSRAMFLHRARQHYEAGRKPVLLYAGDHDCKGVDIAHRLEKTFLSVCNAVSSKWGNEPVWPDAAGKFEVRKFALTEQQIDDLGLMKIHNLQTSSGADLSDPRHADHNKPYVQDYIAKYGTWKVEANALVGVPRADAQALLIDVLAEYIPAGYVASRRAENHPAQDELRELVRDRLDEVTL